MIGEATTQSFPVGDLLTVTTGRCVSPDQIIGVTRIVNHMTGIPHLHHQLARAMTTCKPFLLEQHPWLGEITVPDDLSGERDVRSWLAAIAALYGEMHDVEPLPSGAYVGRNLLTELAEMVGPERIIAVEMGD